jgi:ribonuclease Z
LFMTTHMSYDPYVAEETVAEVREHWKGPFHFGAPDGIVVNVTKDQIWVREGVLPDFPNSKAPQFDFGNGQLVVPHPPTSRDEIQNQEIRDQQLDPDLYYPEGYKPELLEEWPVEGDLVVPIEAMPENLKKSMSDRWSQKVRNTKILEEQAKDE